MHIKASLFEYKGCLKPTAAGQLLLPQDVWAQASAQTLGSSDPFAIELTTMGGGVAEGPVVQHVIIAQATIKGSIYYNSYSSMLPGAPDPGGGMALIPGGRGAGGRRFGAAHSARRHRRACSSSTTCNGCHSVSANGARLISQQMLIGGFSYQLAPDTPPNPAQMVAGPRGAFGALYPDGIAFLATSTEVDVARTTITQGSEARNAVTDATLYRTDDGTVIGDTGIPAGALMPMFSPDGTLLVFNDVRRSTRRTAWRPWSYDTATHKAADYRVVFTETDEAMRPGWPFVLPDNSAWCSRAPTAMTSPAKARASVGVGIGPISDLYIDRPRDRSDGHAARARHGL